jgi:hypothetical protein
MDIKKFARMEQARTKGKLEEAIVKEDFTVFDLLYIHEIVARSFTQSQLQKVCKDLLLVISEEEDPKEKEAWETMYNVAHKRLIELGDKNGK